MPVLSYGVLLHVLRFVRRQNGRYRQKDQVMFELTRTTTIGAKNGAGGESRHGRIQSGAGGTTHSAPGFTEQRSLTADRLNLSSVDANAFESVDTDSIGRQVSTSGRLTYRPTVAHRRMARRIPLAARRIAFNGGLNVLAQRPDVVERWASVLPD